MHLFQLKQNHNIRIYYKSAFYTIPRKRKIGIFYYLFRKNDSRTKLKTIFVRLQYDIKAHE